MDKAKAHLEEIHNVSSGESSEELATKLFLYMYWFVGNRPGSSSSLVISRTMAEADAGEQIVQGQFVLPWIRREMGRCMGGQHCQEGWPAPNAGIEICWVLDDMCYKCFQDKLADDPSLDLDAPYYYPKKHCPHVPRQYFEASSFYL